LRGEDIPLEGRIVALCDVFDGLISERPYKKSRPLEAAIKEIDSLGGKSFDPELVDALHEALPSMRDVMNSIDNKILTHSQL
jgi:putative two-component system response regulator